MPDSKPEDIEEHQLEDYIKKELEEGFSLKDIEKILIKSGHPKEFVKNAIKKVEEGKKTEKKINKTVIIILIIIIIISSAFAFTILINKFQRKTVRTTIAPINIYGGVSAKEIEFARQAMESNDTRLCGSIKNHNLRYDCLNKIWLNDSDCRFHLLLNMNIDECFFKAAVSSNNPILCFKIENKEKQLLCKHKVYDMLEANICSEREDCIRYKLEKDKNTSFCKILVEQTKKERCYEIYAEIFKEVNACYQIKNNSKKDLCIFNTVTLQDGKDILPQESFYRLASYDFFSSINVQDCILFDKKMEYMGEINQMYKELIEKHNLNDFLDHVLVSDYCYLTKSIKNQINVCENILDHNMRLLCTSVQSNNCQAIENNKIYKLCLSIIHDCSSDNEIDEICRLFLH